MEKLYYYYGSLKDWFVLGSVVRYPALVHPGARLRQGGGRPPTDVPGGGGLQGAAPRQCGPDCKADQPQSCQPHAWDVPGHRYRGIDICSRTIDTHWLLRDTYRFALCRREKVGQGQDLEVVERNF